MAVRPSTLEKLAAQLKGISESLAAHEAAELPAPQAKRVRRTITEAYEKLRVVVDNLDPIKQPGFVFDPSNPSVAGRIVAITMVAQQRKPLAKIERFYGSGVYARYYNGDFPAYVGIANREHPIYVGKADPTNPASKTAFEQGDKLASRLTEHKKNIAKATTTLNLPDFEFRVIVVQTGWQTAAEDYLINLFKPIWNSEVAICYGFGKHGDDPKTRSNNRSPWDTLHPGRDWAHRDPDMKDARASKRIVEDIHHHLAKYPPIATIDEILHRFLDELRTFS